MPYYPLSQIKPNLYTNGDEYVLSTNKEKYTGYYYEISNGKKFTGKTPQDGFNIQLIINPAYSTNNEIIYDKINNQSYIAYELPTAGDNFTAIEYANLTQNTKPRILPTPNPTTPTQQDYTTGVFTRYFCKKNNENIYFEIDKQTFTLLSSNSPQIAFDLYSSALTLWYLIGNKDTVSKANKGLVDNIERTKNWYGFSQYFRNDFLKYYLGS
jgi:hypothetical protein